MAWMIAAIVAATAVSVGTTAAGVEEGKKQADETEKNQDDYTLKAAYLVVGNAWAGAPGAVKQ